MHAQIRLGGLMIALAVVAAGTFFVSGRDALAQEQVTIPSGDFYFCSPSFEDGVCETVISVGGSVVWDFAGSLNSHTSSACGASCDDPSPSPLWDSGTISGGTYSRTFDAAGSYLYFCAIHPTQMRGRIVVQAAPPTSIPPPAGQTPAAGVTPVATSTPGGSLPPSGQGPSGGDTSSWWLLTALLAGAGGLLGLLGATAYRQARR